jgi:hypothetical protein
MLPANSKSLLTLVLLCLLLLVAAYSGQAQQDTTNVYSLAMPGKNWSLNIPKWALTEGSQRVQGDATSFNGAREANKKLKLSPVLINIWMEPAKAPGDAQALTEFSKKKLYKQRTVQNMKELVYNNIPLLRYTIDINPEFPSPGGNSLPGSKVFHAYFVKDDVWITVQLNFLEFKKEDEQYLHSLLEALKIEDSTK